MTRIITALATGFGMCTVSVALAAAQAALPRPPAPAGDYQFRAATGLLVFHVRIDRAPDFEQVVERIGVGLDATTNPQRRAQAAGWRVFRSSDTPEAAIYVMMFDPVVPEADYDPVKMLTELAPADVQPLYERLKAAVIRVERLDLERLR